MNAVGKNKRDILSRQLAFSLLPRAAAAAAAAAGDDDGSGLEVDSARGLPLGTPSVLPVTAEPPADDEDVVRSDDDDAL